MRHDSGESRAERSDGGSVTSWWAAALGVVAALVVLVAGFWPGGGKQSAQASPTHVEHVGPGHAVDQGEFRTEVLRARVRRTAGVSGVGGPPRLALNLYLRVTDIGDRPVDVTAYTRSLIVLPKFTESTLLAGQAAETGGTQTHQLQPAVPTQLRISYPVTTASSAPRELHVRMCGYEHKPDFYYGHEIWESQCKAWNITMKPKEREKVIHSLEGVVGDVRVPVDRGAA